MNKLISIFIILLVGIVQTAVVSAQIVPEKKIVMDGLLHPWSMAFLSEDEALVAEKDGDLVRVNLLTKKKRNRNK